MLLPVRKTLRDKDNGEFGGISHHQQCVKTGDTSAAGGDSIYFRDAAI